MNADREVRRRLRQAYEEAWAARTTSGKNDDVLVAWLRAHELGEVLDETAPIHHYVFDLWHRDVPPSQFSREAMRLAGRAALQMLDTGRSIWRAFQPMSDEAPAEEQELQRMEDMPDGKRGVRDLYRKPASALLTLELGDGPAPELRRYAELATGVGGWSRPRVWFDMFPSQPRAYVLVGSTVVGEAHVPRKIWQRMTNLADGNVYADGSLEFRVRHNAIETGTLLCCYVADPPGPTFAEWIDAP